MFSQSNLGLLFTCCYDCRDFKTYDVLLAIVKSPMHAKVDLRVESFDGENVGVDVFFVGLERARRRRAILSLLHVGTSIGTSHSEER